MSIRPSAHPRLSRAIFGATCVLALGAALVASLGSGGLTSIGLTFLGGVVVIGIAAALMSAIVSPMSDGAAASSGLSGRGARRRRCRSPARAAPRGLPLDHAHGTGLRP